jgi:uncharacterized protein YlxW (UPF0749 family)
MAEITLFNDSSSQMSVMALGKAINWNPKTTLIVSEKEAEILLKYGHIKKYEDISSDSSDGGERVRDLELEVVELKAKISKLEAELESLNSNSESSIDATESNREFMKAKAKELGIEFAKNIKTEQLAKLIEGK